jgi:N-acetylglucosamine-6-phosphate deacetylase
MTRLAIHADRALTPLQEIPDATVLIEDGRIAAVGPREAVLVPQGTPERVARGMTLAPGFVDVHIHGAGGHDVMEATPEALREICEVVARHGTTSLLATTVTAAPEQLCRSAEGIARFIHSQAQEAKDRVPVAEILGLHFEGPFISAARRGVHPPAHIAAPSVPLLCKMLECADGCARLITLAPELPGAMELMDAARDAGLAVSMGHTDADYSQAHEAIAHGAHHAAHVFNAMRPFSHRETGVLGAVLTSPEVTAELIADGVHVDAPAMQLLLAAKGPERVILVSDGTAATGMPDGKYQLGGFEVTVSGGVCRNAEGRLAGSTLTLDRALRNIVALGVPLADAVRMLTLNPARLLGLEGKKGILAPGADADVVLLDAQLNVKGVITRGTGLAA